MSGLSHHPEESKVVYNDDRPVELRMKDGRSVYTTMGELLDDWTNTPGKNDLAVVTFSPDSDHAEFIHKRDVENSDTNE